MEIKPLISNPYLAVFVSPMINRTGYFSGFLSIHLAGLKINLTFVAL